MLIGHYFSAKVGNYSTAHHCCEMSSLRKKKRYKWEGKKGLRHKNFRGQQKSLNRRWCLTYVVEWILKKILMCKQNNQNSDSNKAKISIRCCTD